LYSALNRLRFFVISCDPPRLGKLWLFTLARGLLSGANYKPNSAKWIVCEGALKQKSLATVQDELERLRSGASKRIREYISDVRTEDKLDIRIEGTKLVYNGKLP
jgi:hypothetical protein